MTVAIKHVLFGMPVFGTAIPSTMRAIEAGWSVQDDWHPRTKQATDDAV